MINVRIVNTTDNEELWFGTGEFVKERSEAQNFETVDFGIAIAEAIASGICFIGGDISQEEMESNPEAFGFEELQVLDGDVVHGTVEIYESEESD